MGAHAVLTALRADGAEFPIEASISQHEQDGQKRFTVILRDVSERVKAHEALRRSKEELQELSAASHIAREQEKNRIARELHDELGQALTMLQMDVAWCKAKADGGEPEFAARLDRMQALLKSTVAATRRIAADLRPLLLDDLGIVPAVEWLAENFTQRTGVPCRLTIGDPDLELDSVRATAVFRIVQESLTNIAKHAERRDAEVVDRAGRRLAGHPRERRRPGFVPQDPRKPASFGLVGVRERAALLRGEASITSGIGEGTTIEVRLPLGDGRSARHDPRRHRRRPHDPARGLKQLLQAAPDLDVVGEAADGHEVVRAVRDTRVRRAAARHVDAGPQRHGAHPPGEVREAEAAHPRPQHARGAPVRGARDPRRRLRLPDQGKRRHACSSRRSARSAPAARSSAPKWPSSSRCRRMPHAEGPPHATLSDREFQVFQRLVAGAGVTQIAGDLNLSVKTVSTHKARLMEKLGVANQAELIHYALKHRLTDDPNAPA